MERKLKIASWILIGILLLPLFQHATRLANEIKLKGAVTKSEIPVLSVQSWFEGEYQDSLEPAMNDRFGFRNFFVRLNNQVKYSFFGECTARGVIRGKENYLYEKNYIKAQQGEDFLGDSLIEEKVKKLKDIQDYFEEKGKHVFVVFAAGKGSFYPEYFPEQLKKEVGRTNLESYTEFSEQYKLNYIDCNSWFLEMKDTSQYCLYPKTGIHWSYYGMCQVIDSLENYLRETLGVEMPVFEFFDIEESRKYKSSDADIEQGMNVLFNINRDKMAYPKLSFKDKDVKKLYSIAITDSFYWGLHNMGISERLFEKGEFWYYYNRIYGNHLEEIIKVKDINTLDRLETADVIILMATEATIARFPFGFVEDIWPLL